MSKINNNFFKIIFIIILLLVILSIINYYNIEKFNSQSRLPCLLNFDINSDFDIDIHFKILDNNKRSLNTLSTITFNDNKKSKKIKIKNVSTFTYNIKTKKINSINGNISNFYPIDKKIYIDNAPLLVLNYGIFLIPFKAPLETKLSRSGIFEN